MVDRYRVFGDAPISENAAGIVSAAMKNSFGLDVYQLILSECLIQLAVGADDDLVYRRPFVGQIRKNALFWFPGPFHGNIFRLSVSHSLSTLISFK